MRGQEPLLEPHSFFPPLFKSMYLLALHYLLYPHLLKVIEHICQFVVPACSLTDKNSWKYYELLQIPLFLKLFLPIAIELATALDGHGIYIK